MELIDARLRRLRDQAPVGRLLLLSWAAALVWLGLVGVVIEQWRWIEWSALEAGFYQGAGGRSWSIGSAIFRQMLRAVRPAAMVVLFIAVVYTPALMALASLFERQMSARHRGGFGSVLRQDFAGTLSGVLAATTITLAVQVLPLLILLGMVSDPRVVRTLPQLLLALPLPVFIVLMAPVCGVLFNLRRLPAILLTLLSLGSLIALPVVIQAASMVCASPFLIVLLLFLFLLLLLIVIGPVLLLVVLLLEGARSVVLIVLGRVEINIRRRRLLVLVRLLRQSLQNRDRPLEGILVERGRKHVLVGGLILLVHRNSEHRIRTFFATDLSLELERSLLELLAKPFENIRRLGRNVDLRQTALNRDDCCENHVASYDLV